MRSLSLLDPWVSVSSSYLFKNEGGTTSLNGALGPSRPNLMCLAVYGAPSMSLAICFLGLFVR